MEVAALRESVEDIRARVVERPMTAAEAAGETPLTMSAISLALDDVDMHVLPGAGASDAEVEEWLADYVGRAATLRDEPEAAQPRAQALVD